MKSVRLILVLVSAVPYWSLAAQDEESPNRFNNFDWELTKNVERVSPSNVVISPISVKIALATLYEGAKGNSSRQLEKALNFGERGSAITRTRFAAIMRQLRSAGEGYDLDIGTKVYVDHKSSPKADFSRKIEYLYNASVESINFNKVREAADRINAWASGATHGHIANLVSPSEALERAVMLIVNAIYFNGKWLNPFPPKDTAPGEFYPRPGTTVTAQFMKEVNTFKFYNSNEIGANILRLPFESEKYSMFIVLPHQRDGLKDVLRRVTPAILRDLLPSMEESTIRVLLPKFAFDFTTSLVSALQELGVRDIFTGQANLSGLVENPGHDLYVSNILQKAGIQVNEFGSIAYAATEVDLVSKFGEETIQFEARHPFMFFIEEEPTNTIVFVGKVTDPTGSTSFGQSPNPGLGEFENGTTGSPQTQVEGTDSGNMNRFGGEENNEDIDRFTYFDINLMQRMRQETKKNFVVSPSSIKSILGMVYEGAGGKSASEISLLLRLPNNKNDAQDKLYNYQKHLKNQGGNVKIKNANRVLVNKQLNLNQNYQSSINQRYSAQVTSTDFSSPEATANEINQWVSRNTEGFIPRLVGPESLPLSSLVVLLNAMYFKGSWQIQFEQKDTKSMCFYTAPSECKRTPMMTLLDDFKSDYIKGLHARILELPYNDPRYSMVILLPKERGGLQQLINDLPFQPFLSILDKMEQSEVLVKIPRFTVDYNIELAPILEKAGIRDIFSDQADLSGMLGQNKTGRISEILHRAKIEVNEKGTTAAGGTAAVVVPLMTPKTSEFIADRPFLFFVRDKVGGILFEGQIVEPTETGDSQGNSYLGAPPPSEEGGTPSWSEAPKRGQVHSRPYPPRPSQQNRNQMTERERINFPRI